MKPKLLLVKYVLTLMIAASQLSASAQGQLRVLTYESLLGKYGLAPHLEAQFLKICKSEFPKESCRVEFIKANELNGLLGQMRQSHRRNQKVAYQMVIGLDDESYARGLKESLISDGKVFDESPFAVMVDTLKVSEKDRPKSWKELVLRFPKSILLQDPRSSTPGVGWIRSVYEWKLLSKEDAKNLSKRSFPSWTSSYSAFQQGEAPFVWSYLTSEAYHRCSGKLGETASPRYQALVLEEGYPVQREWVARVKIPQAKSHPHHKRMMELFEKTLFEDLVIQEKIYTTQWMYPTGVKTKEPDCFSKVPKVKRLEKDSASNDIQKWIDDWTL